MRTLSILAVLVVTPALANDHESESTTTSAEAAEATYEYRETVMKGMGAHMGAASQIVRGKVARTQDLAMHARAMHDYAGTLADLWPAGTGPDALPQTETLPTVWTQPDDFAAAITAYEEATAAFLTAATTEGADVNAAFRGIGRTCGGCHDTFRKDDDH